MSKRVCIEPGCPQLTDTTRCPAHTRTRDKQRGTRQQRGYDQAHVKLRAEWAAIVARGTTDCARCGHRIEAGEPWDLGHHDTDRSLYAGPEHRRCNRATAGRIPPRA